MHSNYSDGVHPPAALVDMAREKGLVAIALADHDSLGGFAELTAAAANAGVEVLSAVELSCEHVERDLHVLGYGVDPEDDGLQGMLRKFRETRERRGVEIVEKLSRLGVRLDMGKVLARSGKRALGRPHIAEALVEGGHVKDFREAFARYLGEDAPAYVPKYKMSPADAVAHIHGARGLAFVAHPGYYLENLDAFHALLGEGFDGIEVLHPHHGVSAVERLRGIAAERRLLVSGGSDFHGFAGRDNMGEPPVPYELLARIKERLGR
jgi:predicted metal-dependent phosphoesterase TrpH